MKRGYVLTTSFFLWKSRSRATWSGALFVVAFSAFFLRESVAQTLDFGGFGSGDAEVEFADVPDETGAAEVEASVFFGGTLPESPIALAPKRNSATTPVDFESEALAAFRSRSPSSWQTRSFRAPRGSVFQKVGAEFWSAPNGGVERGGVLETEASATFGLPFFTLETPLLIAPTFRWTQIETPKNWRTDYPGVFGNDFSLFSQGATFDYYFPIDERLLLTANLNAFYNSDYKSRGADSWFFSGYVAGVWKQTPQTNWTLGVYVNEAAKDWKIIPVGGISWRATDDFYVDAIIPFPKVAKRLDWGFVDEESGVSPYWVYVAGDVAGNVWGIETKGAASDGDAARFAGRRGKARYFDYRVVVGLESKTKSSVDWAVEGGVAFARSFSVETTDPGPKFEREIKPKTACVLRFRVGY